MDLEAEREKIRHYRKVSKRVSPKYNATKTKLTKKGIDELLQIKQDPNYDLYLSSTKERLDQYKKEIEEELSHYPKEIVDAFPESLIEQRNKDVELGLLSGSIAEQEELKKKLLFLHIHLKV